MKKVVRKKKADVKKEVKENFSAISSSLTQLYYEIDTIKMLFESMKDDELFDFCSPHIEMYEHMELDRLYPKLVDGKKLTIKERQSLEAFAILANSNLILEV